MVEKETNSLDAVRSAEKRSRTPDFLNNIKGRDREKAAKTFSGAEAGATGLLNANKDASGSAGFYSNEKGGLYTGKDSVNHGRNSKSKGVGGGGKSKLKGALKNIAPLGAVGCILIGMIAMFGNPLSTIGALDRNLMISLGYDKVVAVLEDGALSELSERLSKGEFPSGLAGDFAEVGIEVGQVAKDGSFVCTNKYLDDISGGLEIAATGFDYYQYGGNGELSVLYDGKVISANEFTLAVESNPKLYADYSKALDVAARFFYGDDVRKVFERLDIEKLRSAFSGWVSTGNDEEDQKSYYEILNKMLSSKISAAIAGCTTNGDGDVEDCSDTASFDGTSAVAKAGNMAGSTDKASQLLTMAVSSTEPLMAARAFLLIEEPIQRARISGEGPINPTMNALNRKTEKIIVDVNNNVSKTVKESILETTNFAAAASMGGYSKSEANNFSRDRVLIATGTASGGGMAEVINKSTLDDGSTSSPRAVLKKGNAGVDEDVLARANNPVEIATAEFDDESFTSIIGGNRAVEGGSYLLNTITKNVLAAMPSDASTVSEYKHETDEMLARKRNAERVTLSPFDTSSSNTFLGNIVQRFANASLRRSSWGDGGIVSAVGTIAELTNNSTNSLAGSVVADGNDQDFTTIAGDCTTVSKAANVIGDIYCTEHNTIVTKYMKSYTKEQLLSAIGSDNVDSNGKPIEGSELQDFITNGTEREATVGVQSATVCETLDKNLVGSIMDLLGIAKACDGVSSPEKATGAAYTLSDSNSNKDKVELFSAYVLRDVISSLVDESQSNVSLFKEEYYKKHPRDDSVSGKIARFSGMTKNEAEIALGYASYLAKIRNYDPSQRFAFGEIDLKIETPDVIVDDADIKETLYCYWRGKTEFSDLRNRNQVA